MAAFVPITPVEVSLPDAYHPWDDVDVSAHVPVGATGVILHWYSYSESHLGLRKNGSSDTFFDYARVANYHGWVAIGIDANRIFEAYTDSQEGKIKAWLVGYTNDEVHFFTNGYDKTDVITPLIWDDLDCSGEVPAGATGLIFLARTTGYLAHWFLQALGLRKNGSIDDRYDVIFRAHCYGAIIGCDANRVCQVYRGQYNVNARTEIFLIGYITGINLNTNAPDISLSTLNTWLKAAELSEDIVVIEVVSDTARYYGLRTGGSSEELYGQLNDHVWAVIGTGKSVEGKINSLDADFFLIYGTLLVLTVSTKAATNIEETTATLNGLLDEDAGEARDCGFEWGPTEAYGHFTPTESKHIGETFSQNISGLIPGTKYYFRAVAT